MISLKRSFVLAMILVLLLSLSTVNVLAGEKPTMSLTGLLGPTGMGMVELIERNENDETEIAYDIELSGSPDMVVGKIVSGEVDVAAVPTNLASTLYNRTNGQIQLLAINTLGVLYVLENGDTVQSVADLEGKTINVSGKGATPDFALRYILEENGLVAGQDVNVDFTLQHSLLASALVAEDVDLALLPQPHVTTALIRNPNLRIALDITEEWDKVTDGQGMLAMGGLVVQKSFAEENKDILHTFLEEYQRSVEFVNTEYEKAANLLAEHGILPSAEIAERAIPYSNIVYIDAQTAKPLMNQFYEVLHNFEPKSVGGKLPDEGFYYSK